MLQGRLLSYPDAHRYRLGANYEQIPVNRCQYLQAGWCHEDRWQRGSEPNYFPNSFDIIKVDESYKGQPMELDTNVAGWYRN